MALRLLKLSGDVVAPSLRRVNIESARDIFSLLPNLG